MEENIGIYRRYIADITCIERSRHDISWRKIGEEIYSVNIAKISAIYRRYIGSGRYIGDFLKKAPLMAKNRWYIGDILEIYRWYIGDISLIFWWYFPSFMQHDLMAQITPVLIWRPRCNSNGNMAIQRSDCSQFFIQQLKLIFNSKLIFQRLFWSKFLL